MKIESVIRNSLFAIFKGGFVNHCQVMTPQRPVGIIGYGSYIPMYRLSNTEIARVWSSDEGGPIKEKAVAGLDEDTITIAIEAARNALARAGIEAECLRAIWVGSESPPYAVKPSSTIVAEALGATPFLLAADFEFACKAGTEALQAAMGLVGSEMGNYAMAIGADTAQGRPGDALEFTAASGGTALIVGPAEEALAVCKGSLSYASDTPDFWRRAHQHYPRHGGRFTGEPAYFHHIESAANALLDALDLGAPDFTYAVFHQPNVKFPQRVAKRLGFTSQQIQPGLLSNVIGNTYAGAAITGFSAVLDIARPGDRVLLVSFGSGAGSDAFVWEVTDAIETRRDKARKVQDYIARRLEIDYALYARYRGKLDM
ncbi:MAG: hydroxymethylglutaryl-CoA synthase [Anaerolineae bacterium]|nr:hydroxymethylglutaryl-CoA synthase [Anaerolineae bacterium]